VVSFEVDEEAIFATILESEKHWLFDLKVFSQETSKDAIETDAELKLARRNSNKRQ